MIDSTTTRKSSADLPEAMLIPDTAAAALAGVSRSTWHVLRAAGRVPRSVKLGRAVRWRRAEVELWIEWGCPPCVEFEARKAAARRLKVVEKRWERQTPG
jgi:predicted DNA-binding transcriptional regulator AlpA